jgi:hypothetical protein
MRVTALNPSAAAEYRELMLHAYEQAADAFTSTREERANEPESWWANRIALAKCEDGSNRPWSETKS